MEDEKNLKIKANCVKRLVKERNHYIDEIEDLRRNIQQMELENPDNYDIKKKNEI